MLREPVPFQFADDEDNNAPTAVRIKSIRNLNHQVTAEEEVTECMSSCHPTRCWHVCCEFESNDPDLSIKLHDNRYINWFLVWFYYKLTEPSYPDSYFRSVTQNETIEDALEEYWNRLQDQAADDSTLPESASPTARQVIIYVLPCDHSIDDFNLWNI